MILPSTDHGASLSTVGLIRNDFEDVAHWLHGALGTVKWHRTPASFNTISGLLEVVGRTPVNDVKVVMKFGDWTALVTNGPLGSDVGMIPSLAARELNCLAIRAIANPPSSVMLCATILDVYDPRSTDSPVRMRRSIACADEGFRWVFETRGAPFEFEDVASYSARRVRDRFTPTMLERYLYELGLPGDDALALGTAVIVRADRS